MSRALDSHTREASTKIATESARNHVSELSRLLTTRLDSGPLEIEILGRSHVEMLDEKLAAGSRTYLQDGRSVAISKAVLIGAFHAAYQMLRQYLVTSKGGTGAVVAPGNTGPPEPDLPEVLEGVTAIILLTDPEHLTAANVRKRELVRLLDDSRGSRQGSSILPVEPAVRERLLREAWFVDSLLTSRLHRHTKSPTLWSHRQWLLRALQPWNDAVDVKRQMVDVVMVAGERHERNYYAWCHARYLVDAFVYRYGEGGEQLRESLVHVVKEWCLRHHTDTSGWSFLYYLVTGQDGRRRRPCLATEVFLEVLRLARSLRWTNESVWVFLRTLAASPFIDGKWIEGGYVERAGDAARREFMETSEEMLRSLDGSSGGAKTIRAAVAWAGLNENKRYAEALRQAMLSMDDK